jgi:hypothetical protein
MSITVILSFFLFWQSTKGLSSVSAGAYRANKIKAPILRNIFNKKFRSKKERYTTPNMFIKVRIRQDNELSA